MQKKLRAIPQVTFIVLLVVLVVEGYFLFINKPDKPKAINQNSETFTQTETRSSGGLEPPGGGGSTQNNQQPPNIKTSTYQGIITKISTDGGVIAKLNYKYDISITLKDKNNNKVPIYFNTKEIDSANIIERKEGRDTPIKFNDIKEGESVNIQMTIDETKDLYNNILDLTIIVLR